VSVTLSSSTDSPEQVSAALEAAGMPIESVETVTNEPEPPAPATPEPKAPNAEEKPADDTGAPAPGVKTEPEASAPKDSGKKGDESGVQKRIDELTAEKYELRGRLAQLEKLVKEKEAAAQPKPEEKVEEPKVEKPKPVEAKPKPKQSDFAESEDPLGDYLDALSDFKAEQNKAVLKAEIDQLKQQLADKDANNAVEVEKQARAQDWNGRLEEAAKRYPDWETVAKAASDPEQCPVSAASVDAVVEHEKGPDIMYYLATHPDEAKALFEATNYDPKKVTPAQILSYNRRAGAEIASIAMKIQPPAAPNPGAPATDPKGTPPAQPKAKAEVRVSSAPDPITPVKPVAKSAAATPYEKPEMSFKEYEEWRNAQSRRQ
jgi:hypothetical protein